MAQESTSLADAVKVFEELLAAELKDLERPSDQRHSRDSFDGPREALNQQFLVDAPRAHYRISDEDFSFAQDEPCSTFSQRLSNAVLSCLDFEDDCTPARVQLVRFATLLLSQAGLALSDTALAGPNLALSGGSRHILYELRQNDPCSWNVNAEFSAGGFTEFLEAAADNGGPRSCSADSCLKRGYELLLLLPEVDGPLEVQVVRLINDIAVVDSSGQPIPLPLGRSDLDGSAQQDAEAGQEPKDQGEGEDTESSLLWTILWAPVSLFTGSEQSPAEETAEGEGADAEGRTELAQGLDEEPAKTDVEDATPGTEELHAWESDVLRLPAAARDEILDAWYGHPNDPLLRVDVTEKVRLLAAEAAKADCAEGQDCAELEIRACNDEWGDPARFVWKQLSVTVRKKPE